MNFFKYSFILAFLACYSLVISQPGIYQMTPLGTLNLQPVSLEIPSKFTSDINNNTKTTSFNLPKGWKLKVFHAGGMTKPRFMTWSPDSVLHVADMTQGKIWAMPDKDHDGTADTAFVAATNAFGHDIKFFRGDMYVATEKQVLRFQDYNGDHIYETRTVFIDSILNGATFSAGGGHTTRTLIFDTLLTHNIYLSIGSACNVCREEGRAEIDVYDLDGKNKRIYATGLRNAVGLTLHPKNGKLWANNNGSDRQGNEIPPEWIDIVRENGFYGYPYAYGYQNYFDYQVNTDYKNLLPITSADSQKIKTMIHPGGLIASHSAPMAMKFNFGNDGLPETYRHGLFMVLRGSWNRTPATGAKIIYMSLSDEQDTVFDAVYDFFTGFLSNPNTGTYRGRPVGLETDHLGNIYFTSDAIQPMIGIISPTAALQNEPLELKNKTNIFPNPGLNKIQIHGENFKFIEIFDQQGRLIYHWKGNSNIISVASENWNDGIYMIRVNGQETHKWLKLQAF